MCARMCSWRSKDSGGPFLVYICVTLVSSASVSDLDLEIVKGGEEEGDNMPCTDLAMVGAWWFYGVTFSAPIWLASPFPLNIPLPFFAQFLW